MKRIRPPAVAGMFYPQSPVALQDTVQELFGKAGDEGGDPDSGPTAKAVIAPHAGYVYSGLTAAHAFRALATPHAKIRRIVLLGPAHRVAIRGAALPGVDGFATPLGVLQVDDDGVRRVASLAQVHTHPEAHAEEHSLEVELPFLQERCQGLQILPLVVGRAQPEEIAEILDLVWGGAETRIVISSDLSHYLPYDEARRIDALTAEAILRLATPLALDQACGAVAINGLLLAVRRRGLEARLLDLRNSGDTAGDRHQVVGYGAFGFFAA